MRTSGGLEVADIFRQHGPTYRETHRLSRNQWRVMRAIEECRTAALGGHKDQCDQCGHLEISYNSCRNRHCPKCQTLRKEKWIEARREDLLPIEYFHVVFTLPSALNPLVSMNPQLLYDLLFRSASQTLSQLAHRDGKVSFLRRDYADGNRQKTMTLKAEEFIRRFLLHVLPSRYVQIRHFGLLANRNRKDHIPLCRMILGDGKTVTKENDRQETWQEQLLRICGIDVTTCPVCQKGRMFRVALLLPYRCNSPP